MRPRLFIVDLTENVA